MLLTAPQLKQIVPNAKPSNIDAFLPFLNAAMDKWKINTPYRVAAFVSQIAHESGSFRYVREIASGKAYELRLDLGNTILGEGPFFKGRGLLMVTGKTNYLHASLAIFGDDRLLKTPDLLATPQYSCASAAWFWGSRGLNDYADKLGGKDDAMWFDKITRKINGGLTNKTDRDAFYARAKSVLI